MKRLILFCFAVALAICDILGGSRFANAGNLIIEVNTGGGWETVALGVPGGPIFGGSYLTIDKNFIITATASSNSAGTTAEAKLLSATLSVLNVAKDAAKHDLFLAIGAQDFTKPVAPPVLSLLSHIGGTVLTGLSHGNNVDNKLTFQSFVDPTNGLGHLGAAGFTPGVQTLNAKVQAFSDDASTTISSLSTTYSLTELMKMTLGGNSEINFSANTTLSPAVPEPASIVLFGFGAAGMLGYGWKRRKAMA